MNLFKTTLNKLRQGLAKTRTGFAGPLRSLLLGKTLDAKLLDEINVRLIQADVGVATSNRLVENLRLAWQTRKIQSGDQALASLKQQLADRWPSNDRRLHLAEPGGGPAVILVAGVNGAGKTTSIAKLASHLHRQGHSVMLGACDTFRAAAVEQLEIWSQRLGVAVVKGQQGGDPAAVAFDACQAAKQRGVDVLIVDTAGRLHTQDHLMRQLTKIRNVCGKVIDNAPHEVLLVVDATTGQNAINQAKSFTAAIDVTGIILTKLDGTARGGIVIAIRDELGIPVKFVGLGETPEDIEPFDPAGFVEALFAS